MNHLIIGYGEVGQALNKFFPSAEIVDVYRSSYVTEVDMMHICIPCKDKESFVKTVKEYQEKFKPKYTIIHSSVAVGTCRELGAIHSPVRGIHPNLYEGLKIFPKILAGEKASEIADIFRRAGFKVLLYDRQEESEAAKLFDTKYYGVCIDFVKEVKEYCDKYKLNFSEVYRLPNITYNSGYTELGHSEFVRPVLEPIMTEKIGGHCILENRKLL